MIKNIGLWLDHRKAVILVLRGKSEELKKIESNIERHVRFRGGTKGRMPYAAQYFVAEDRTDKRLIGQLNKYYREIIGSVRGADSILLMGPGEAKHELESRMNRARMKSRIAEVQTADKLTERQLIAKVRKYYKDLSVQNRQSSTSIR